MASPSSFSLIRLVIMTAFLFSQTMNAAKDELGSLDYLRHSLIRLEDTILFALIERAQFKHNPKIYQPNAFHFNGEPAYNGSFLDWLLHETEKVHALVRRYTSPDEYPFTEPLPSPILPPLNYSSPLVPNTINENANIKKTYELDIVPKLCASVEGDDDENYGSAATADIECLQTLSKRVHYGKFIAEVKFKADPVAYTQLIAAKNSTAIMDRLTDVTVEQKLLVRLRKKALMYGQELNDDGTPVGNKTRIDVDMVVNLYKDFVIPLTKKVELSYLLNRV